MGDRGCWTRGGEEAGKLRLMDSTCSSPSWWRSQHFEVLDVLEKKNEVERVIVILKGSFPCAFSEPMSGGMMAWGGGQSTWISRHRLTGIPHSHVTGRLGQVGRQMGPYHVIRMPRQRGRYVVMFGVRCQLVGGTLDPKGRKGFVVPGKSYTIDSHTLRQSQAWAYDRTRLIVFTAIRSQVVDFYDKGVRN